MKVTQVTFINFKCQQKHMANLSRKRIHSPKQPHFFLSVIEISPITSCLLHKAAHCLLQLCQQLT